MDAPAPRRIDEPYAYRTCQDCRRIGDWGAICPSRTRLQACCIEPGNSLPGPTPGLSCGFRPMGQVGAKPSPPPEGKDHRLGPCYPALAQGGADEPSTARIPRWTWRRGGAAVAWRLRASAEIAGDRVPERWSARLLATYIAAFRDGIIALGYVEGRNMTITYRSAQGNSDQLGTLADDLVRSQVQLIVASGGVVSAKAATKATASIPIFIRKRFRPCRPRPRCQPQQARR